MTATPRVPYRFFIIGCGGAGCRILAKTIPDNDLRLTDIAIDTDERALTGIPAGKKILIGGGRLKTYPQGNPTESADAMHLARTLIEPWLSPNSVVFVIAGLGGGAGSGAAPHVARICRDNGALVIAMVSLPVAVPQQYRSQAGRSLMELYRYTDTVIVLDTEWYHQCEPNLSIHGTYTKTDEIIMGIIHGLINALTKPSLVNVDQEDFLCLFKDRGLAIVLDGEAPLCAKNEDESVTKRCLNSPSLGVDYRDASGCFVLIRGGYDLDPIDTEEISTTLTCEMNMHADIIWSADVEKPMEGRVRVYAIMTGIPPPEPNFQAYYKNVPGKDKIGFVHGEDIENPK